MIRAIDNARNDFIDIEHLTETKLHRNKAVLERECRGDEDYHLVIERLLKRR